MACPLGVQCRWTLETCYFSHVDLRHHQRKQADRRPMTKDAAVNTVLSKAPNDSKKRLASEELLKTTEEKKSRPEVISFLFFFYIFFKTLLSNHREVLISQWSNNHRTSAIRLEFNQLSIPLFQETSVKRHSTSSLKNSSGSMRPFLRITRIWPMNMHSSESCFFLSLSCFHDLPYL